jgi:methylglutamate dehydrogenase subunit D
MVERRHLPLRDIAKPGRHGADGREAGVALTIVHPLQLATVIAHNGESVAVAKVLETLSDARTMWAGPDQYFVQGSDVSALKAKLRGIASIIDQSHGRVTIHVEGPNAREVLAKGTPVDLHRDHFPVGKSAMTQMAHVGVHISRIGDDAFSLSVFRGFSESFWEWLETSAAEFGYTVSQ